MPGLISSNYQRLRFLALTAAAGLPPQGICAIFFEFAYMHRESNPTRFIMIPSMSLRLECQWKPQGVQDQRCPESPAFGLGNFNFLDGRTSFKLRCGANAKSAIDIMASLPSAASIMHDHNVTTLFHQLSLQAENNAKTAYEKQFPLSDNGIQWILLVGPYWTPKSFGPFSADESTVCAHETSDSSNPEAAMEPLDPMQNPPPELDELYLLGTQESFARLEEIFASTDELAQPFIEAMTSGTSLHTLDRLSLTCCLPELE